MVDERERTVPPTVLVAEDEPAMLSLVARHLRALGFLVIEASEGDTAWELAQTHQPELVILDVMMPGMSGWEVCKRIKGPSANGAFSRTGVIMLTGIGENLNDMTSPLFAADGWLNKPFDFAELDAKIREILVRYQHQEIPLVAASEDRSADTEEEGEEETEAEDRGTKAADLGSSAEDLEGMTPSKRTRKKEAAMGSKRAAKKAANGSRRTTKKVATAKTTRATAKRSAKTTSPKRGTTASPKRGAKATAKRAAKKTTTARATKRTATPKRAAKTTAAKRGAAKRAAKVTAPKRGGKRAAAPKRSAAPKRTAKRAKTGARAKRTGAVRGRKG